ncbi:ABC transporter ATP-binding protein [Motiliproteus sp. MSK22-1]|uniref:ABC transporter ATP-binding protein n=1 Tax=Motiliproteus sp. MSK22-1 TaxID=1897630 RepID=UPI000975CE15|nr:sn-glycerol-3-phosphate ABC transporter ATP-binding protein UgpC [Motiliproteus sp. MSK22-1]OMH25743.1 ABC transporter [Motiliproteus sp. MSK22-1]
MSGLVLNKINKAFGNVRIIRDLDLQIADGEFVVFVGPSGCGKSTLLRLIAGLEEASGGEIFIDNNLVNDLAPKERGIGMVFQSYALYPHMTVYENIAFGLKLSKNNKDDTDQRVKRTAEVLQLDSLVNRKPKNLSGGQRQRVAIGRAMAREPKIMLFDEPLSNLDAALRVQMRAEIGKLHERLGSTMIYVTHDQVEAMTLADKIVVLNAGRIEQVGTPQQLYDHPETVFVASFIGSPKMNLLRGVIAKPDSRHTEVEIPLLGTCRAAVNSESAKQGEKVLFGIRPEHVLVRHAAEAEPGLDVVNQEYLGNESFIYLQHPTDDEMFLIRVAGRTDAKVGHRLALQMDADHCHLFGSDDRAFPRAEVREAKQLNQAV